MVVKLALPSLPILMKKKHQKNELIHVREIHLWGVMTGEHWVLQQSWEWLHGASCSGDQHNLPHYEKRTLC
jgi:hypothetical protein